MAAIVALVLGGSESLAGLAVANDSETRGSPILQRVRSQRQGASWLCPLFFGFALQFTKSYRIAILSLIVFRRRIALAAESRRSGAPGAILIRKLFLNWALDWDFDWRGGLAPERKPEQPNSERDQFRCQVNGPGAKVIEQRSCRRFLAQVHVVGFEDRIEQAAPRVSSGSPAPSRTNRAAARTLPHTSVNIGPWLNHAPKKSEGWDRTKASQDPALPGPCRFP